MKKVILGIFSLILCANANAQDVSVDVTSNTLSVERLKGIAIFKGDVKALYQDITLTSEELEIQYNEKSKSDNKIEFIIARDNVKLVQGLDVVTAEYAKYYVNKDEIIFKRNVVLNRNGNTLEGENLIMNTVTKQAQMSSGAGKRVQAVYFKKTEEKTLAEPVEQEIEENQESLINE